MPRSYTPSDEDESRDRSRSRSRSKSYKDDVSRSRSRSPSTKRSRSASYDTRPTSSSRRRDGSRARSRSYSRSRSPSRRSHYKSPAPRDRASVNHKDLLPSTLPAADKAKPVIHLSPEDKDFYESFAKGTPLSKNSDWLDKVARVDSVASRAPYLQRDFRCGEGALRLREQPIIEHHDLLYRILGVATLIGKEEHDQDQVKNCLASLTSMGIHQVTVWRRWMALENLRIPRQAIPGSSSLPLDLKEHDNPHKENDKIHYLFGAGAESEMEKLLKEKKKRREAERLVPVSTIPFRNDPTPRHDMVQKMHVKAPVTLAKLETPAPDDQFKACRIAKFLGKWHEITSDSFVLQAVQGYRIPFKGRLPQYRRDIAKRCDPNSEEARDEVHKLLEKEAIVEIAEQEASWISPMFFVPKKDGSLRPVINLKELNERLHIPHFKMEGLLTVKDLLTPGAFMAKLDLKDAYFSIPIDENDRKYLAFRALGKIYMFRALPFGLAPAPYVYTRVTKPVAAYLRTLGMKLVVYLDDWLFIADSEENLQKQLDMAIKFMRSLGFIINIEKSELTPTQKIEFLGFELNSIEMSISVPRTKIIKLRQLAQALKSADVVPARQIAKFCGLLASFKLASEYSRIKARALQRLLKGIDRTGNGFNKPVRISSEAREEAAFWSAAPVTAYKNRLVEPPISCVIRTDASKKGWGMQADNLRTGGRWSNEESKLHINILELKAIHLGLLTAFKTSKNIGIRIESDNTTAIAFINRRGGTRSRRLHRVATDIWQWALDKNIYLTATHIAGVDNIEADQESRTFKECCEWAMDSMILQNIFDQWGTPDIDLFASRVNRKCESYYSLNPDPDAVGIDAFSHNWKGLLAYAFPPFNLIGRTIRKAKSENADLILVTPEWKSAPFWPMLVQLSNISPIVIDGGSIRNPHNGDFHPLYSSGTLRLNVWKISCRYG